MISLIVVMIISIITLFFLNEYKKEGFSSLLQSYDCVISINIHENVDFLIKQLHNIRQNVNCTYVVVLNCNNYMYYRLQSLQFPPNVFLHNLILNKQWEHGSLLHGIYNNMVYATKLFSYKYFICCSSRNMFANNLQLSDLENLIDYSLLPDDPTLMVGGTKCIHTSQPDFFMKNQRWHWPKFFKSKLGQYCILHQYSFYTSPHEGLVFNQKCCKKIIEFFDKNYQIQIDLFNLKAAAEEFGLQTCAKFLGFPFYYIGNGCCNENMIPPNSVGDLNKKFMYKVPRI